MLKSVFKPGNARVYWGDSSSESVQRPAQLMKDLDIGALPECDGKRLLGMITDRDITLRSTADGKLPVDV